MRVASGLPSTRGQRDKGLGRSNASHSLNPSTTERIWIVPGPIAGMPAMPGWALPAWYNVYGNRNNWEFIASRLKSSLAGRGHCLWLKSSDRTGSNYEVDQEAALRQLRDASNGLWATVHRRRSQPWEFPI